MGFTLLRSHHREFVREYLGALVHTPQIFRRLAFRRRTLEEELKEALLRGSLRKAFNGFDLLCLGLGIVIGSGWSQLTGTAAQQHAGAAIIISYLFAGLATLLAAACFAELCIEYPVSGGAFSYVMATFGEFPAFVTLVGLLLEYGLGMAAVARGFSSNFAGLINMQPRDIRLWVNKESNGHSFDIVAAIIVIIMSLLLSLGVRESATFITAMTVVKLALLVVVCVVGYTQGAWPPWSADDPQDFPNNDPTYYDNITYSHWSPFTNPAWDVDGILVGAAQVFFTFTGFDAIGNAAEEVQKVTSLPGAILGTVLTTTVMYLALAIALVVLVWPNVSCPNCGMLSSIAGAPILTFTSAFVSGRGLKCMQYVVSLAALFGIVTALTVGLFSASRIVMAASRDWLLPPFLARVSRRTQTPLAAQMVLGVVIALLALLVEVDAATAMVSFGTLVALWLVCNAQMYRRYFPDVQLRFTRYGTVETAAPTQELQSRALGRHLSLRARKVLVYAHMLALNAVCIGLAISYAITTQDPRGLSGVCPATAAAAPAPGPGPDASAAPSAPPPPSAAPTQLWLQPCSANTENYRHGPWWWVFVLPWALITLSFQVCCPLEYQPAGWHVPWWLMPWLPSLAIGMVTFSVGALPEGDFWKTGAFFLILLIFYLLFSLPMSYIKHSRVDYTQESDLNIVELTCVEGQWQPARPQSAYAITPAASARTSGGTKAGDPALMGMGSSSSPVAGKPGHSLGGLQLSSSQAVGGRGSVGSPGASRGSGGTPAVAPSRPGSVSAAAGGGRPPGASGSSAPAGAARAGSGRHGRRGRSDGRGGAGRPGSAAAPMPHHSPTPVQLGGRALEVLPPTREGEEA